MEEPQAPYEQRRKKAAGALLAVCVWGGIFLNALIAALTVDSWGFGGIVLGLTVTAAFIYTAIKVFQYAYPKSGPRR